MIVCAVSFICCTSFSFSFSPFQKLDRRVRGISAQTNYSVGDELHLSSTDAASLVSVMVTEMQSSDDDDEHHHIQSSSIMPFRTPAFVAAIRRADEAHLRSLGSAKKPKVAIELDKFLTRRHSDTLSAALFDARKTSTSMTDGSGPADIDKWINFTKLQDMIEAEKRKAHRAAGTRKYKVIRVTRK